MTNANTRITSPVVSEAMCRLITGGAWLAFVVSLYCLIYAALRYFALNAFDASEISATTDRFFPFPLSVIHCAMALSASGFVASLWTIKSCQLNHIGLRRLQDQCAKSPATTAWLRLHAHQAADFRVFNLDKVEGRIRDEEATRRCKIESVERAQEAAARRQKGEVRKSRLERERDAEIAAIKQNAGLGK